MRRFSVAVLVAFWVGSSALAAGPRCTLLADGSTVHPKLAEMLVAELKGAGVEVAVRSDIADDPAGAAAEVLLILNDVEGASAGAVPLVELVAIDPVRGARLNVLRLPADRPTAELAKGLAGAAVEARRRAAAGVRQVFAVPHFVSRTLTPEHDDLEQGFADAVARGLWARDGVAVVEVEHAAAVARELRRRNVAKAERAVPAALLAHYTVSPAAAAGDEARVSFEFRVTTSAGAGKVIERGDVPLSKAQAYVSGDVVKLLVDAAAGAADKPLTPAADYQALVRAGDALVQYGSPWATPVREAALLVNPGADHLRGLVAYAQDDSSRLFWGIDMRLYVASPPCARWFERTLASLDHYEYLIGHKAIGQYEATHFAYALSYPPLHTVEPALAAKIARVEARQDAFRLKTWPLVWKLEPSPGQDPRYVSQRWERGMLTYMFNRYLVLAAGYNAGFGPYWPEMTGEQLTFVAAALEAWPAEVEMPASVVTFLQKVDFTSGRAESRFTKAEYVQFLERLGKSPVAACRLYARYGTLVLNANGDVIGEKEIRAQAKALHEDALAQAGPRNAMSVALAPLTGYRAPAATQPRAMAASRPATRAVAAAATQAATRPTVAAAIAAGPPAGLPVAGRLRAVPVQFNERNARGDLTPLDAIKSEHEQPAYPQLRMTAADGFDLFWNGRCVLLHRDAGILDAIVRDPTGRIADVAWDGRNVWVVRRPGSLAVVSPTGRVLAALDAGRELPPCERWLAVHCVGPGNVIATGLFGSPLRAWFARVTIGEAAGAAAEVKVFHSAPLAFADTPAEATRVSFMLRDALVSPAEGARAAQLLVRRDGLDRYYAGRPLPDVAPLRVDMGSLAVSVEADPLAAVRESADWARAVALPGGDFLYATDAALLHLPKVGTAAFADGQGFKVLATFARRAQGLAPVAAADGVHFPGAPWLRYDPKAERVERLEAEYPPPGPKGAREWQAGRSAVLGLMVWGNGVHYRYVADGAGAAEGAGKAAQGFAHLTPGELPSRPRPTHEAIFRRVAVNLREPQRPDGVKQVQVDGPFGHLTFDADGAGYRQGWETFRTLGPPGSPSRAINLVARLNGGEGKYATAAGMAAVEQRFGISKEQLTALRAKSKESGPTPGRDARLEKLFGQFASAEEGANKIEAAQALIAAATEAAAAYHAQEAAWVAAVKEIFSDKQWDELMDALEHGSI